MEGRITRRPAVELTIGSKTVLHSSGQMVASTKDCLINRKIQYLLSRDPVRSVGFPFPYSPFEKFQVPFDNNNIIRQSKQVAVSQFGFETLPTIADAPHRNS